MKKEQILERAKIEKKDEGKEYNFNYSLASMGAYLFILLVILLVIRILRKENPYDILGILVSSLGVFQYKPYKKIEQKRRIYVLCLFITIGVILFSFYI